jgi:hypothetical protein
MPGLTATLKKAPRWSLYVGGGVVLGGLALKLYSNRTTSTSADTGNASTASDPAVMGGTGVYGPSGSPGPIISPVILPSAGGVDQSGTGLGDLQALYLSGTTGLYDAYSLLLSQLLGQNADLSQGLSDAGLGAIGTVSQIALTAGAGSAPQPLLSNPTPVVAAIVPPAPPAAAATPPAPPVAAPPVDRCVGEYPNLNNATNECYKVGCASGNGARRRGRWHLYRNSAHDTWVGPTC